MKKKLLFINGHLNTGGVEKSLIDVLQHLDYDRYDVDLLLLETIGDYAAQIPPQVHVILRSLQNAHGSFGACVMRCIKRRDWFSLKMRIIFLLSKFLGLESLSAAKKILTGNSHYDCVIGYRPGICTQIASFAVDAERRITWWHHGAVNIGPVYLDEARKCDAIVVVSDTCRKMLAEAFPSLSAKMLTIPNMIDPYPIRVMASEFNPYPDGNVHHIVSVGRLAEEKHFENAIYAAKHLKDRGFKFQWHLVGSGALGDSLREQAQQMDVTDCFLFEGNQPNPYPYMKHADLFVHPSYIESHGIVVLEALALGVPCVVTRSAGPCEFIEDGINGILTEQNAESLTEKVLLILQDQELRKVIRTGAVCPKQFLPGQVSEQIGSIIK